MLGFGQTEHEVALQIIEECASALSLSGKDGLRAIEAKYADDGDRFKAMKREEAPERYTYFWASYYEVYPGRYFVAFTMHHINRKHAFSPDGWAMLETHWILSVDRVDTRIYREIERA